MTGRGCRTSPQIPGKGRARSPPWGARPRELTPRGVRPFPRCLFHNRPDISGTASARPQVQIGRILCNLEIRILEEEAGRLSLTCFCF